MKVNLVVRKHGPMTFKKIIKGRVNKMVPLNWT